MNYTTSKAVYNLQVRLAKKITALLCFFMVPIIAEGYKCNEVPELKWASGSITFMVNECFQTMNRASIQNWGAPVHPFLGMNQCSCVTDKLRRKFKCQEEYAKFVEDTGGGRDLITEFSKSCILDGAMGEDAKKAFIDAGKKNPDNSTEGGIIIKEEPKVETKPLEPKVDKPLPEIQDPVEESKTTKKMSWDDLINK